MKYKVEWRGEEHLIEADTKDDAISTLIEETIDDIQVNAVAHEFNVYRVRLNYCGSVVNVLAEDEFLARDAAQTYVETLRNKALSSVTHGSSAHTLIVDLDTGVEVEEQVDESHYEITPDGEWEEGEYNYN